MKIEVVYTICFQMSYEKLLGNGCTPMGTVPISVIYGFEYPCEKTNCNTITRRRKAGVERTPLPKKTRGCLSDIKQYRRAMLVSGRATGVSRLTRDSSLVIVRPVYVTRSVHKCQNMSGTSSWYWKSR